MIPPALPPSPLDDWHPFHVEQLCLVLGLTFTLPRVKGQQATVSHPGHVAILTVPADRAIQPLFIRASVGLALGVGSPNVPT